MPNIGASQALLSGDIAFLSKKEFDGKLISDEGTLTAAGDLATITASGGKDLYLVGAKLSWSSNSADLSIVAELKAGPVGSETVIETYRGNQNVAASGSKVYEFKVSGIKVATGENILIELIVLSSAGFEDCEGFIQGYEEDTGADPIIA